MVLERRTVITKSIPFLLIGLLVFVCYLYFFVDIPEMIATIQSVNPFYYSLAIIALLLDMLFYALTWHYFLLPLSVKTSFKKTFLFVWIGAFVDILVPAESVSGDVSKAYLMSKETGKNTGRVAASVVSHRILSSTVTLGSLIIGSLSFLVLRHKIPGFILNLILLVSFGTTVTLVFLFLLCFKEHMTRKITDSLLRLIAYISRGRWRLTSLRSEARRALKAFHQAIDVLGAHPTSLVPPVIFSIVSWLFSLLISLLVFLSLGYPFSFSVIVTVVTVYSISCAIQVVPAGIPAEV
ncbi:MAG: flippase-like domain-containing protein, partial [Candidatus Bathyarchaeota archaeon]